jgi:hypothetical protein
MRDDRVLRILRPTVALVALAALLVVVGLAFTGPAHAGTKSPTPKPSKAAKVKEKKTASPAATRTPVAGPTVQRGAEVRAGEDIIVPVGTTVPSVAAMGGDVTINGRVTDAVIAFGGDVAINGSVGTSVVAFGGDVIVRGTVDASVISFGGDVKLRKTADVGRDLKTKDAAVVLLGGELTRDPGAQVHAEVKRSFGGFDPGAGLRWGAHGVLFGAWLGGFSLFAWLFQTAFCLVLALVATALMPGQLRGVQKQLARRPWASLGWGALTFFIILPAVLVVLVISLIGLLLVLPYVLFVLLAYFFVTTSVGAFVAQKVLSGFGGKDNLWLAVTLGVVATTVVSRIPVVGPLALLAMMVMGTGAAVLAVAEYRRRRREAAAAQAAANAALAAAVPGGTQYPASAGTGAPGAVITPIVQTSPAQQQAAQQAAAQQAAAQQAAAQQAAQAASQPPMPSSPAGPGAPPPPVPPVAPAAPDATVATQAGENEPAAPGPATEEDGQSGPQST